MPRTFVRPFLAALLSCVALVSAAADDRTEPIDFMIALDRSLSMRQEIDAVKEYVKTQVVDQILQPGDTFIVVAFYGQNELAVFENLTAATDKAAIKRTIDGLTPKEAFTDIGFALDRLRDEVRTRCNPTHKKTLILVTDGIDEPPPGSKYSDPGSWRGHEYMRVTSETQKEGWKVIVLGVGDQTLAPSGGTPGAPGTSVTPGTTGAGAAPGTTGTTGKTGAAAEPSSVQQLAKDLGGQYVPAGQQPSAGQIAQVMPDLTGRMTVEGISVSPMNRSGEAQAVVRVKTESYSSRPQIWISGLSFKGEGPSGPVSLDGLISQPVIVPLPQSGVTELHLDLRAAQPPSPGSYKGTLEFAFGDKDQFPASQPVEMRVNSLLQEYPWIVPVAAVALAAVVALLLLGIAASNRIKVRLLVEEKPMPAGRDVFSLRKGRDSYLREARERFDIAEVRTPKTIARLVASRAGGAKEVSLARVKPERFPELDDDEQNVLDGRYVVRSETGGTFHLRFERVP